MKYWLGKELNTDQCKHHNNIDKDKDCILFISCVRFSTKTKEQIVCTFNLIENES